MSAFSFKRCVMLLLLMVALPTAVRAEDAPAAPKAKAKAKAAPEKKSGLQGYYAIIASELQLTDDQRTQLAASLASRSEAMKKWDADNGEKVAQLTEAQKKARDAKDSAAAKQAGDDLKKLRASRTAIEDDGKAKLQAVLTPEQRAHLQGYNLYIGAMIRFSKAELTDAQKVRAKAMALETGKALPTDITTKDLDKAKLDLASRIEELLTDVQREAMAKALAGKSKSKAKAPSTEKE